MKKNKLVDKLLISRSRDSCIDKKKTNKKIDCLIEREINRHVTRKIEG